MTWHKAVVRIAQLWQQAEAGLNACQGGDTGVTWLGVHTRSTVPEPRGGTCFHQAVRLTAPAWLSVAQSDYFTSVLGFRGAAWGAEFQAIWFVRALPPHGVQTASGCCVGSMGAEAPCAAGQQPRREGRRQSTRRVVTGAERSTASHFLLFLVFFPGGRKVFRSRSKTQRSLMSFSLPCASPGAGLYFPFSLVIIAVSHLVIKTLKEIISVFIQTLCLERHVVPIQRDRYFYII